MKLLLSLLPRWLEVSLPIFRITLCAVMLLSAITVTVAVLFQNDSSGGGTNAISGIQESYYSSNKGASKEGRLKKITIICSIIIAVSIVLYFLSLYIPKAIFGA